MPVTNQFSQVEKPNPSLAPPAPMIQEKVCMDFGEFGLLLPAADLVSLVAPQQLTKLPESASVQLSQACGYLEFAQGWFAVFCFNKSMQFQPALEAKHKAIVLLRTGNFYFGIACCELKKMNGDFHKVYPVPQSMSSRKQPFTEFTIIDQQAVGISSAATLLQLLNSRGVQMRAQTGSQQLSQKGVG